VALIHFKNYTTYIMIKKSGPKLKIFCTSWKFHGASSNLMHPILEVYGSRKICQIPHDSDRGQGSFEEMQTILCEIEAILNSGLLLPLSADPNDLAYLSPGHFLVGTTLNVFLMLT